MTEGTFVGRVWRPGIGPALVQIVGGQVLDKTNRIAPTMHDLLELPDPVGHLAAVAGVNLGTLEALLEESQASSGVDDYRLLAPCDFQAVKAAGVTFAGSMVERVIEERAAGDPERANVIRAKVADMLGGSLRKLVPGSDQASRVKATLMAEGLWSQYLEVGIGPDAEVFTKCPPMAAVGYGAAVGLHPISKWNNPEPEVVLAVNSRGDVCGAALGNDVNLRDVEGRSALLLGKAKDNNASASIGPFLRLFDPDFTIDDVRTMEVDLCVEGTDGFVLNGRSSMGEISRDPLDLVRQAYGRHHQYPDGFMLFCGTMFAPIQDRDAPGQGFTHHLGDVVTISTPALGSLRNTVQLATTAPEWTFGISALMRNLAGRGLV